MVGYMQRYFGLKKVEDNLYLHNSDYHHIKNVMRMKDEDLIEVIIDNNLYLGCIENVNKNLNIKIKKELNTNKEFLPVVNLIVPLLKESKMDLILQKATEMGVYKITICPFNRCVVRFDDKKIKSKLERWNRIVKEASEQSFRMNIPSINYVDCISKLSDISGLKIICSTKKNINNIKRVLTDNKICDTINIVIGPEGGFTEKEEVMLSNFGFVPTSLGNRIMRVESVPLFILSIINYEYME